MDGARFYTTDVARGKAQVSAMFGQPSGNLARFGASPVFANLNTAAQGRLYPIGKAMLSAIYGQPSAALAQRSSSPITQALNEATGGRFRFLQGALPIVRGGFTVGAIAASGASAQQDEDAVRAALAAGR